jgi:hypothetical protein
LPKGQFEFAAAVVDFAAGRRKSFATADLSHSLRALYKCR